MPMRIFLLSLFCLSLFSDRAYSQITTPVIRANFGVDADLRSNYFNGSVLNGNDDWFTQPGSPGSGAFVIDTTGAASIVSRYATDIPFRRSTFSRGMNYPIFSIVNNHLLLDAALVRDFHGDDSTVFASGSNKNGFSPANWTCPVAQGIPDKNDILDMMVHVRRAGSSYTDSLWMMGAVSLDNTTGNRYFDFEMYQTDLVYNRPTRTFSGYGPDAGHTSWEFDAAGNITKPGDIIFSAEYQSSSLTFVEARIWVQQSALSIIPSAFSWSGEFDGASSGSTYGYASIQPNGSGAYYTGLQSAANTWGGPFSIILQNDNIATDYIANQYVEFSVNLTKLGLDPATSITSNICGMPFKSLLVKTRASASFTAELKDFVAPFIFFNAPRADVNTSAPAICEQGSLSNIFVTNPLSTSVYEWTTPDGNIVSSSTLSSIYVDTPGTYIVKQFLVAGCNIYASDTIQIALSNACIVLPVRLVDFQVRWLNNQSKLNWEIHNNQFVGYFEIQRSNDGTNYETIGRQDNLYASAPDFLYSYIDQTSDNTDRKIFYRIKIITTNNSVRYSDVISLQKDRSNKNLAIYPNPVRNSFQIQVFAKTNEQARIELHDASGKLIIRKDKVLQQGDNVITIYDLENKPVGIYIVTLYLNENISREKILVNR
jgi:hypothetical protein